MSDKTTGKIDISPDHLKMVQDILREHLSSAVDVWVFGSRARWTAKQYSDLDLALECKDGSTLSLKQLAQLETAYEDSDLPWKVDIADLNSVSAEFKAVIVGERVRLGAGMSAEPEYISDILVFNPKRTITRGVIAPFVDMASLPINARDITNISEKKFNGGGAKFKNGDTLFARITPCLENGKTAQVKGLPEETNAFGSTEFIVLAAKEESDKDFIYYLARHPEFRSFAIARMEGTSGRQRVPWQSLVGYPKILPDKEDRGVIGQILKSFDDKINLNQRMNKTLEEMAQAIFKCWFVDFEPTRAKMAGESDQSICTRLKITPEILALFPNKLVESELGEIPGGWSNANLGAISTLNPESWSKKSAPESLEYVDLANTKWGEIQSTEYYLFKNAPSRARRKLQIGDTIVGTVRPGNGSYAYIGKNGLTGSTGFAVLRPKAKIYSEFTYLTATNEENIERLTHLADGGAYPAVKPDIVLQTRCFLPCNETLIEQFSGIIQPLFGKREFHFQQINILSRLRDTLLPKLLSGELSVENIEGEAL